MRCVAMFVAAVTAALGQTAGTGGIQGTVVDAGSLKPVPAVVVTAIRAGLPPFARHTKSGGDGAFQIQGLTAGSYSICVQAAGDEYVDPCLWKGNPINVTLASGQNAGGLSVRVSQASILYVQVKDAQGVLSQAIKDGRRPDLSVGVWGPDGLYYPAHVSGGGAGVPGGATYGYRLAVPRDTALKLAVTSHDVKLGDGAGVALPANAALQAFQRLSGEANPQSFSFSVLGLLP